MNYSDDVKQFLDKFGLSCLDKPGFHPMLAQRCAHIDEELAELKTAIDNGDLPEVIDALLDIVYISIGTAHLCGFDTDKHWAEIQRANMSKVRGTTKRGHNFDVKKPENWVAPNHTSILKGN